MAERRCKIYCCSYYHDCAWWGVDLTAYDWEDATVRAKKLGLRLDGELVANIPAKNRTSGLIVKCLVAIKNAIYR